MTSADALVQRGGGWPAPRCMGTEDVSSTVATVTLLHGCGARSQQRSGGREGHGSPQTLRRPRRATEFVIAVRTHLPAVCPLLCQWSESRQKRTNHDDVAALRAFGREQAQGRGRANSGSHTRAAGAAAQQQAGGAG